MFLTYIFVVNLFIGIQCKVRTNVLLNQILLDSCKIISKVTVTRILRSKDIVQENLMNKTKIVG